MVTRGKDCLGYPRPYKQALRPCILRLRVTMSSSGHNDQRSFPPFFTVCIHNLHNPIMQYILGSSLHKYNAIIVTCRGCPIVLTQRAVVLEQYGNRDTSKLFKMAAPGRFESQNKRLWNSLFTFIGKSLNNFNRKHYVLWFKVILLFQWR